MTNGSEHPEEMRSSVEISLGKSGSIRASARATPAGLIALALVILAILMPAVLLARARSR